MSGKKKNAAKAARKEAQKLNPVNWEQNWAERILSSIQEFANKSVRLRFKRDIAAEDRINWTFGSDVDLENDMRRFVVTEWFVPIVDGKAVVFLEDGVTPNPAMVAHKFILRYDHLQQDARAAQQMGRGVNIGRYYLPEVPVTKGDKGWEAKIEENNLRGQEIIFKALDRMEDTKRDLERDYGKENDDGKYIGLALVYNKDENLLQLVTHTKHPLDVIERKDGEMNYIDLPEIEIDSLALDGWDPHALNIRSAVERHAADNRAWTRVVKPSLAAYKRFSVDLADYIMSVVEEVYKRAAATIPADAELIFEQNPTTGFLEASYINADPSVAEVTKDEGTGWEGTQQPIVKVELPREDAAAVLMIAGRIEPDMWFHVDYDFKSRFNAKYGNGKTTILEAVV